MRWFLLTALFFLVFGSIIATYKLYRKKKNKEAELFLQQRKLATESEVTSATVEMTSGQNITTIRPTTPPHIRQQQQQLQQEQEQATTSSSSLTLDFNQVQVKIGKKLVLDNITGQFRAGRLTAIMGGSGAGKTTFLRALLGKVKPTSGSISVNSHYSVSDLRTQTGFVPQDDTMLNMLTVRQLLNHSAYTRLPAELTTEEKDKRVSEAMELLNLSHIADVVVGDDVNRGVSGGEKKRVSIAMELVADPLLLFLDEPTSGLDASAAVDVVDGLRQIADKGRIVASVIHQPRYEVFSLFDDVLLLGKGGVVIYFGPVQGIAGFFASMHLVPEAFTNPADFYLDVVSSPFFQVTWAQGGVNAFKQQHKENKQLADQPNSHNATAAEVPDKLNIHSEDNSESDSIKQVVTIHLDTASFEADKSIEKQNFSNVLESRHSFPPQADESKPIVYAPSTAKLPTRTNVSWFTQVYHLLLRNLYVDLGSLTFLLIDTVLQIIPGTALAIPTLAKDPYVPPLPLAVSNTCPGIIRGRCEDNAIEDSFVVYPTFFICMIVGVASALWAVRTFGKHMSVFFRDRDGGQSTSAYWVSKILYDVLHVTRCALVFLSFFFFLSSPRGSFWEWFGVIWTLFFATFGVSYFISALVSFNHATTINVVLAIVFSVTSGLNPNLETVKGWGPLYAIWTLSYNRWGAEAMVILNQSGQPNQRVVETTSVGGYDMSHFSLDLGVIVLIGLMWRVFALILLARKKQSN